MPLMGKPVPDSPDTTEPRSVNKLDLDTVGVCLEQARMGEEGSV